MRSVRVRAPRFGFSKVEAGRARSGRAPFSSAVGMRTSLTLAEYHEQIVSGPRAEQEISACAGHSLFGCGRLGPTAGPTKLLGGGCRRRLYFLGLALPGLVLIYIYYEFDVRIVDWPLSVSHFPLFRDFSNLWVGAIDAIHNRLDLLFDERAHVAELGRRLGIPGPNLIWSYPPTALVAVLPFGLLPFGIAAAVWTVSGLAAYVFASGLRDLSVRDRVPWLAAIALCPGVFICAAYGQTAFFISALMIAGFVEARRRPMIAGACFALLAVKPQIALAVPVVLLALRAWRAIAYMVLFGVIFLVATVAVLGFEPWKLFIEITLPNQMRIMTQSRFDPVLMSSPYFMLRGFGLPASLSQYVQILITIAAMVLLYVTVRCERDRNIQIVMAACATLLASAYMRTYELPLLVAAVARVCASEESAARLGKRLLVILIGSVTIVPLAAWLFAIFFKVSVAALIPLVLLAIFAGRALLREIPSNGFVGDSR